ncbi:MAG: SMP-30/gluconolactonase/LRE family protein, partial [Elusimicrobia bacterium]|nr:SMP-30/gluconolactonase/LRE family protein [Elusimicrobiota bacterium]
MLQAASPSYGRPGDRVTLIGAGFGSGPGKVFFNYVPATVQSWTDTNIEAVVPTGTETGFIWVQRADNIPSNRSRYTVVNSIPIIMTIAGGAPIEYAWEDIGDGRSATMAQLGDPNDIAVDDQGNIYVAESLYNRIRKVDLNGIITTVAGNGTPGFSGDGGSAASAQISMPLGIALDASGNLYIADTSNCRVRKVNSSGIIQTVAGNGVCGFDGEGGPATAASLGRPSDVEVDGLGNLYIAVMDQSRVRKVNTSGVIFNFAGTGSEGASGDGGPATNARLGVPYGLSVDLMGNVY